MESLDGTEGEGCESGNLKLFMRLWSKAYLILSSRGGSLGASIDLGSSESSDSRKVEVTEISSMYDRFVSTQQGKGKTEFKAILTIPGNRLEVSLQVLGNNSLTSPPCSEPRAKELVQTYAQVDTPDDI